MTQNKHFYLDAMVSYSQDDQFPYVLIKDLVTDNGVDAVLMAHDFVDSIAEEAGISLTWRLIFTESLEQAREEANKGRSAGLWYA